MAKKTKSTPRASVASKAKAASTKAPKAKPKTKAGASKVGHKAAPKPTAKPPAISAAAKAKSALKSAVKSQAKSDLKMPAKKNAELSPDGKKPPTRSAAANLNAKPTSTAVKSAQAASAVPIAEPVQPTTLKSSTPKGFESGESRPEKAVVEVDGPTVSEDSTDEKPGVQVEKKVKRKDEVKIDRTGDLEQQWKSLFERSKGIKPIAYKMSENYEAKTPLLHKVLGWGYVLTSQNNRLEVLFQEGIKFLIANYKAS